MTLQQLRYVMEVAACGSFSAAAAKMFVTQPSLSKAISELEQEMDVEIFRRTSTGSSLTDEGVRFVSYARQVVESADQLEANYKGSYGPRPVFSVASLHNALVIRAMSETIRALGSDFYEFSLNGNEVTDIVRRVRTHQAEIGVIYRSELNADALAAFLTAAGLGFDVVARVPFFALLDARHELARRATLRLEDLADLPCVERRSWHHNSVHPARMLYHVPEAAKRIVVSDGASRRDFICSLGGYSFVAGALPAGEDCDGLARVPLEGFDKLEIGVISRPGTRLSPAAQCFVDALRRVAQASRQA